jgi:hypothetical protein
MELQRNAKFRKATCKKDKVIKRGVRLINAHINLKTKHMKTASKILRYIIAAVILYAVLSYCQEINDCLMKY